MVEMGTIPPRNRLRNMNLALLRLHLMATPDPALFKPGSDFSLESTPLLELVQNGLP